MCPAASRCSRTSRAIPLAPRAASTASRAPPVRDRIARATIVATTCGRACRAQRVDCERRGSPAVRGGPRQPAAGRGRSSRVAAGPRASKRHRSCARTELRRQVRPELVAVRRKVIQHHTGLRQARANCAVSPCGCVCAAVAAPENNRRKHPKPVCDCRQVRRMPERVGAIQHVRRRRAERPQHATTREEVPDQSLARWNERVGQHVPRTGLELTLPQRRAKCRTRARAGLRDSPRARRPGRRGGTGPRRRPVEDFVDQGDESGAELREMAGTTPDPSAYAPRAGRRGAESRRAEARGALPAPGSSYCGVCGRCVAAASGDTVRPSHPHLISCKPFSTRSSDFATFRRWSRRRATSA